MVKKIQLIWRKKKNLEKKQYRKQAAVDKSVNCAQKIADKACLQQVTEKKRHLNLSTGSRRCRQTDSLLFFFGVANSYESRCS